MNVLIYEREKMIRAGELLNSLKVSGSSNFRALAELADILDSGKPGELNEKEEKKNDKFDNESRKTSSVKNMAEQKI